LLEFSDGSGDVIFVEHLEQLPWAKQSQAWRMWPSRSRPTNLR